MLLEILVIFSSLLGLTAFGLLAAFWIVARRAYPLGALPWLAVYWFFSETFPKIAPALGISPYPTWLPSSGAAPIIATLGGWMSLNYSLLQIFMMFLILSNVAYLLPKESEKRGLMKFLAAGYRYRNLFGALVLIFFLLPQIILRTLIYMLP